MLGKGANRMVQFGIVCCLAVFAAGVTAAFAVAGSASASGGATTGQHGQECPPGYHDVSGTCEHNGGGGGNCGDNQSGNNNGLGNNGNDSGFGHNGDCEAATSTPTSTSTSTPTSTRTSTTSTPPNAPPNASTSTSSTTSTTPTTTGTFQPPTARCAVRLFATRIRFVVGRRGALIVTVTGLNGKPLRGVTVIVRGAGVSLQANTNSAGKARFVVLPRSAGAIRISLRQPAGCETLSRLARAVGVFKPPKPNYTG
jgi:hypothetical protein